MRTGILKAALLGAAAVGMISLAGAGVAHANPVQIGFAVTGSSTTMPTTIIEMKAGSGYAHYHGGFKNIQVTASTGDGTPDYAPPKLLGSVDSLRFSPSTASSSNPTNDTNNVFWVFITEKDISKPLGSYIMASTFSANALTEGDVIQKVHEATYVDPKNSRWVSGTAKLLSSYEFSAPTGSSGAGFGASGSGSAALTAQTPDFTGAYSLTEVFTFVASTKISSNSNNSAQANIQTADVPEPGSLALLGTGLLGLGLIGRRRRRKA